LQIGSVKKSVAIGARKALVTLALRLRGPSIYYEAIALSAEELWMDLELAGRVAVVTGGASGIGWACAHALSREGCKVALWDLSTKVNDVAGVLAREFGGSSLGISVDVCDFAAVQEAVRQTETGLGPVSHLVHAAAVGSGLATGIGSEHTGNGTRRSCNRPGNGRA
jgi:hypothetical protein